MDGGRELRSAACRPPPRRATVARHAPRQVPRRTRVFVVADALQRHTLAGQLLAADAAHAQGGARLRSAGLAHEVPHPVVTFRRA
eukprot:5221900-Prymnesium_polylepis.2